MINYSDFKSILTGFNSNHCPAKNIRAMIWRFELVLILYLCINFEHDKGKKLSCDVSGTSLSESHVDKTCAIKNLTSTNFQVITVEASEDQEEYQVIKDEDEHRMWHVYNGTFMLVLCCLINWVPDRLWKFGNGGTIKKFTKDLKKKEDIPALNDSYQRIKDAADQFYELLESRKLQWYFWFFMAKTIAYGLMDLIIVGLINYSFSLSNVYPQPEDFPTEGKCHIKKTSYQTSVDCTIMFNIEARIVVTLFFISHIVCFCLTSLILAYYMYSLLGCQRKSKFDMETKAMNHLKNRMSAPLLDLLDKNIKSYDLNEIFILYHISWSGIDSTTFKLFIGQYNTKKTTSKKKGHFHYL